MITEKLSLQFALHHLWRLPFACVFFLASSIWSCKVDMFSAKDEIRNNEVRAFGNRCGEIDNRVHYNRLKLHSKCSLSSLVLYNFIY